MRAARVLGALHLTLNVAALAWALAPAPASAQSCGGDGQRACCLLESSFGACQPGLIYEPVADAGQCGNSIFHSTGICHAVAPCGGADQRACCVGEAGFGPCQAGLIEQPAPNSGQCGNFAWGIQSSGICRVVPPCGAQGQRACCLGEATFGACQSGLVELPAPNSGQCGNAPWGIQSSGVCAAVAPCGGANQRACCLGEAAFGACQLGMVEQPAPNSGQCGNLAPGIQSGGICRAVTPCGAQGQRACCVGEAPFGACQGGLAEVPAPNSGQCGSLPWGIQSSGLCQAVTACGGLGQRACCVLEAASGACQTGLVEVPLPNAGLCAGSGGIQSSGVCVARPPCGAKGQRACCLGEAAFGACQAGLIQVPGCSGDCTCGGGISSDGMCTVMEGIPEPGTGWTAPATGPASPLRGFADLHVHLFGHMAHGGGVLAGAPYDPAGGINAALRPDYATDLDLVDKSGGALATPSCPAWLPNCGRGLFHGDHLMVGAGSDPVGVGTKDGGDRVALGARSNLGAPIFSGWPTWNTTTHQQTYHAWLERAWRGGLRLMVMLAVTNEALCLANKHLRGTDCADGMAAINAQLDEARRFEAWVDAAAGGAGLGWFRIATTPAEARAAISAGKLAVVLGIEMDNLFNCKFSERDPATGLCTDATVRAWVDEAYRRGVRHVFPIHNFDNAFGSPATWQDGINVGNRAVEGSWWQAEACPAVGYGFKLNDGVLPVLFDIMMLAFGFNVVDYPPGNAGATSCNAYGLTTLGHSLLDQLMLRGMVVDVDHMSAKSLEETLARAEARSPRFPVVASHVQFFDLNDQSIRHERMRTRAQLLRIRGAGGLVAAMLKDDAQDTDNIGKKLNVQYGTMSDDCRHSSKTWAQAYRYAVDVMGGPVAFGSDFNGIAGHVGPRFGSQACGGDPGLTAPEYVQRLTERMLQVRSSSRLQYPFTIPGFGTFERQQSGHRAFDFNVDGLAHIGLLPDLVADLGVVGLAPADLDPLFASAEAYVATWERAIVSAAANGGGPPPSPTPTPTPSATPGPTPTPGGGTPGGGGSSPKGCGCGGGATDAALLALGLLLVTRRRNAGRSGARCGARMRG